MDRSAGSGGIDAGSHWEELDELHPPLTEEDWISFRERQEPSIEAKLNALQEGLSEALFWGLSLALGNNEADR